MFEFLGGQPLRPQRRAPCLSSFSLDVDVVGAGSSCAGLGTGLDGAVVGSRADSPLDCPGRDVGVPPDPRTPTLIPSASASSCAECFDPRVFPSSFAELSFRKRYQF